MSPSGPNLRQVMVSLVLLSSLQYSSGVRFTSFRYVASPIRRYSYPWKYVPYVHSFMPRSMQRRFMWKEMDETVDEFMDGVASGARTMKQIFTPPVVRYRKPSIDFDTQPSKVKYIIKKPSSPYKHIKVIKFRPPKKTIQIYNRPIVHLPSVVSPTPPKPNLLIPFMTESELRHIEREQEKRVESQQGNDLHEHSHQNYQDDDVVTGKINEFNEGWTPIQTPFSTQKPFAVSKLHTQISAGTTPPSPVVVRQEARKSSSYEVTEHAEESIQKEQAFKPTNHFEFLTSTTETPNYPEYFLKTIQPDDHYKPRRTHTTSGSTPSTFTFTSSTSTMSNRLPPRSTTERPFKRYNLHRPKSSKLFFGQPSSSVETAHVVQTTPAASIIVSPHVLTVTYEPPRTTRETIKTTREPIGTTAKEYPKPSTERIRSTRNESQTSAKIRIKNTTLNEGLKNILNKHRGTVKFGEKQS